MKMAMCASQKKIHAKINLTLNFALILFIRQDLEKILRYKINENFVSSKKVSSYITEIRTVKL